MRPLLKYAGFLARRGRHTENDDLFGLAFARGPEDPKAWRAAATAWVLAKRKSRCPEARELIERYLQAPDDHTHGGCPCRRLRKTGLSRPGGPVQLPVQTVGEERPGRKKSASWP